MAAPGTPTFDQLRLFLAIIDEGSFAAAGRKLNRAVSVVSYGIANLEAQLGLTLFEREGTRKPVLTDRSAFTAGRDFAVTSHKTWRLADLDAKHALLREGIDWGNMPLPMVADDLTAGTLVRLALPDHQGGTYRFCTIWRRDTPPGPAPAWLRDQFVALGTEDREDAGLAVL